jgi:hypothetical protein
LPSEPVGISHHVKQANDCSNAVSVYDVDLSNDCAVAAGLLASASSTVAGGSTATLNVELSTGAGLVTGTAIVNGSALPNPQISISSLCGTWASKSDGTYFQYLPPGTYTAQVTGPSGGSLGTFTFTIVAGQTTTANFPTMIVAPTTATVSAVSV